MTRIVGALGTEALLVWRYRVVLAVAVATVLWVVLLRVVPPEARPALLPWILFLDLTGIGFFFVPAMELVERSEGVTDARSVTRLSPAGHTLVRAGASTALSLAASVAVVAAAGVPSTAIVLSGVALTSAFFSLLALVLILPLDSFTGFMTRVPTVAIPLLLPAIVYMTGLSRSPWLHLSPATSGAAWMTGHASLAGALWLGLWVLGLAAAASPPRPIGRPGRSEASRRSGIGAATPLVSLFRVDRRNLLRDALSVMVLAGVPLVAVAVRAFESFGVVWLENRYDLPFGEHLPFVWAFLLVLHTPVMFGSVAGLLFLEERDERVLPAVALTRTSIQTLLVYRLGAAAALSFVALLMAFPLAGATHGAGPAGLIAAAAAAAPLAPLTAVSMTAFAGNRAQGIAAMKILTLPLYLPVMLWFASGWTRHTLDWIPSAWSVHAMWSGSFWSSLTYAAIGTAFCLGLTVALGRRFERRATEA